MTHDLWSLPLRRGQGGAVAWWYWTTLSVLRAKNRRLKLSPHAAVIMGLIQAVNSFLMSTKNKKCKLLRSYFIIMGQWVTDSDPRPTDPSLSGIMLGIQC